MTQPACPSVTAGEDKKRIILIGLILVLGACSAGTTPDAISAPLPLVTPALLTRTPLPTGMSISAATWTRAPTREPTMEPVSTATTAPEASETSQPAATPTITASLASPAQGDSTPTLPATDLPADPDPAQPTPLAPTASPTISPLPTSSPTPVPETPTAQAVTPLPPTPIPPSGPWVYETTVSISTYGYELGFQATQPDDPIYPYPRLNFSQVGPPAPRAYQALVLENEYVALTILPELGGRLYGWVDKSTGRQLLYQNPVVKPTSWGYRDWWLAAGGIEWTFPVEEHGLNEWRPWSYSTGYSQYGLSVTVSDVEDRTGMEVGVTLSLDGQHAYVVIQPWARNITGEPHQYQLWLNAMLALNYNTVSGPTQIIIPANQVTVHSTDDGGLPGAGGVMSWPVYAGRDLSWYSNWSGYLSFFVPAVQAGFVGLYDHSLDQGVVRAFPLGWPVGTKIFGPTGLSPTLWTDDGSNYIELWSGATGSYSSYGTLQPGQTVGWVERWYPVNGLGGFNYANERAALRLAESGDGAEVGVFVTSNTVGTVCLWAGGNLVQSWPVALSPGQAFRSNWIRPPDAGGELGLRLTDDSGAVVAQTGYVP